MLCFEFKINYKQTNEQTNKSKTKAKSQIWRTNVVNSGGGFGWGVASMWLRVKTTMYKINKIQGYNYNA